MGYSEDRVITALGKGDDVICGIYRTLINRKDSLNSKAVTPVMGSRAASFDNN